MVKTWKRKQSILVFFVSFSKHINVPMMCFFLKGSNKPKVFQLGAERDLFDWPQMMVFCCSEFHFPEASNTIVWHQSKNAFNSLPICGLMEPPCFPTTWSVMLWDLCIFGACALKATIAPGLQKPMFLEALCVIWLPVCSEHYSQSPIIHHEGFLPTHTMKIFLLLRPAAAKTSV